MGLLTRRRPPAITAAARTRATGPRQAAPIAPNAAVTLASPWADPDALSVVTWAGLLDLDPDLLAGFPVTRQQATSLPVVSRGRDVIAHSCARLDLFAANGAGRLTPQPRAIAQPEVGRPRFITLAWTVDELLFDGWAVWEVAQRYAEDGRPMTFRYVPNTAVEFDDHGNVAKLHGRPVSSPFDVVRFDAPREGLLTRAAETIRAARLLHRTVGRAARTPTPDVELHQTGGEPLTETEVDNLIARWVAARQGKNGGVAFTNASVQAIMHGQQPQDLLVAARKAADLDLARHMNLPAWAVDAEVGGTNMTYSNVPARSRELIDYTLAGYVEAITARLSLDDVLAAGVWCGWSADVLTNGDFGDRMTAYKAATEAGVYSAEELRRREAGQPIEGTPA
jgi:hypothetical protein